MSLELLSAILFDDSSCIIVTKMNINRGITAKIVRLSTSYFLIILADSTIRKRNANAESSINSVRIRKDRFWDRLLLVFDIVSMSS